MIHRLLSSRVLLAVSSDGATPVPPAAPARILRDPAAGTLVIDLAPMDLPANTPHHMIAQPPVATLEIPETGFIYGFRVQVVDSAGHALPDELIHHFNLIDPGHRELFLPISRRLLAAGHETGTIRLPRLLFGLPLKRGEHVVASGMVENLTPTSFRQARVRLVMSFTPAKRPWPLFSASPWQMDVAFPVGDKSFTLPPGRSSRAYEGSPVVPGKIVGLGGHMHAHEDGRARAPLARPSLSHLPTSCSSTSAAPSTPTVCTGVAAFTPRIARSAAGSTSPPSTPSSRPRTKVSRACPVFGRSGSVPRSTRRLDWSSGFCPTAWTPAYSRSGCTPRRWRSWHATVRFWSDSPDATDSGSCLISPATCDLVWRSSAWRDSSPC